MKKVIYITLCIVCAFFVFSQPCMVANALDTTDIEQQLLDKIDSQVDGIDFDSLDEYISSLDEESQQLFLDEDFYSLVQQILTGENVLEYDTFFQSVINTLFSSVKDMAPTFTIIIIIALISSITSKMNTKQYENSSTGIINFVCTAVIIVVLGTTVTSLATQAVSTITSMKGQMDIVFPILVTLTTALGATSAVAVFQPAIALMSGVIGGVFSTVILSIFFLYFSFAIVGNLSTNIKLNRFNNFFMSVFKWFIGICFTVFFAFIAIQGMSAGAFDSVSIRTAKYTISSYVPILGGYLSEGFDLIMASSILIKNSIGVVGILLIFGTVLLPIVNIMVFGLMLKLVSAIVQPLADSKVCDFLDQSAKALNILTTSILGVAFMYIIMVGLVMSTGNALL